MEPLTDAQQKLLDWLKDYISENRHSPSIRQMMKAMGLRSPAPIQSRLEYLRDKGYIEWVEGKTRSIRLLRSVGYVPILGEINAGDTIQPSNAEVGYLDVSKILLEPNHFALKVMGDSMEGAFINSGDIAILKPISDPQILKDGKIVAATVDGKAVLRLFYEEGDTIILQPANSNYASIKASPNQVEIMGVLVGVWRSFE